jgi:prolyl-tRNA synthetase
VRSPPSWRAPPTSTGSSGHERLAPADVHLVATGKDDDVFAAAEQLVGELERAGVGVLYDDRRGVSPGVKFADSELLGVPTIVVVGRRLVDGVVELKDRRTGSRTDVPLADAVSAVLAEVSPPPV